MQATPAEKQNRARQLQVVLNRAFSGNVDEVSREPEGDLKDGLRDNRDRAGFAQTTSVKLEILLDRVKRGTGPPIWLFSYQTLRGVPRAFEEINAPEIDRFIPRALKEIKLFSLPLWRWLGTILSLSLAMALASLVTRGLVRLLRTPVRRMTGQQDDRYLLLLRRSVRLILLAVAIRILAQVAVSVLARTFWIYVANIVALAGFTWLLIQFSDIVVGLRSRQLLRRHATNQLAVLALVGRLFKILMLFLAVVLLLHGAGVNVSAMLAGLGLGGVALALAAQKTLENLFGGITITTREAARVGDFCQLADEIGTIEDIGLGSTRVRTLDRAIVSIPNAKISQMNLKNYSMRDKIWFHHVFGLRYDTSPEQMRYILTDIAQMLRGDARVESQSARIRLIGFGPSSLNLEVFAYVNMTDFTAFLGTQEDLLLRIMDIVAASGTGIALPSQTTYLDRDKWGRADKGRPVPPDIREHGNQVQSRESLGPPEKGVAHSAGER
jgi:MscS family membrane protein